MPGFNGIGRLALGQLPTVSFAVTTGPLVFSVFSQPFPVAPSLKVYLHPPVNFEVENPKSFNPPTTGPLVFTRFSEPLLIKKVDVNAQTDVKFRVLRPTAATPGPISFNKFSEPSFSKVRPQSDPSWNLFQAPIAAAVVTGGDFADFDLVQSKKGQQQGWTGFVFVPPVVTPVFTQFSQPQAKGLVKEGSIATTNVVTVVTVVQPYVFSEYSQPRFRSQAYLQPNVQNELLRPGAATPANLGTFSPFDQPQAKPVKEGYITNTTVILQQYSVFSKFDQPFTRKVLQQDNSFVNLPVVTVVFQPYVFSDFGQPQVKRFLEQPVNFTVFPQPVVVTQVTFSGFSDFGMPRKTGFIQPDFLDNPIPAVIQNYVFTQFSQPQSIKPQQQSVQFIGSLGPAQTPPWFVFSSFSQPQLKKFNDQPTWFVSTSVLQPYVFSSFAQPQSRLILQTDQSFVNLPVVITVTQPYLFSPFDTPQFRKAPQFDTSVQFQVLPPPQIISVVTFTGFSEFGGVQLKPFLTALYPSVLYDVFVPVVLPEDVLLGGKFVRQKSEVQRFKVESSTVDMVIHDKAAKALTVKFNTGREYTYNNVDDKKVKGLVNARSSGKYLHNNIKGKYFTTRMK